MLIIEGIDGVGKTTLSNQLKQYYFKKFHFDYDKEASNLFEKYNSILLKNINELDRLIFDRSFISEVVYGLVLRKKSRINENELKKLFLNYSRCDCKIIYMIASKETLLLRNQNDHSDLLLISEYYQKLNDEYEKVMIMAANYIKIVTLNTDTISIRSMKNIIKDYIK